jgi:fumarate reductase subunit C
VETLSHPYRPNAWAMAAVSVFFGANALFIGHEAIVNERGLIINGLIHLGPDGATVYDWCITGLCAVFVVIGVLALIVSLFSSHRLTLTATEVSVPRFGFSRPPVVVKLTDVQHANLQVIHKQRFFNIYHPSGTLTITESHLPSRAVFEELCAAIVSRAPGTPKGANPSIEGTCNIRHCLLSHAPHVKR